ncbi:MAG: indole-3-glycerol phosphate synthase TrpC [Desulfotignum sp.]|nr:indole-3-glycerol phosphate synthase TrpC [Desulfotignum sp.]MCF8087331.1 indole-3-glycerol phosphate synthase TrpC [Desulfotignum sp.]MCF8136735.1 indole-3-glycerol phosphate synthase TrpC [Desulfotignum sp.]
MAASGFLKTVQEIKQAEIADHRRRIPLASLRRDAETLAAPPDFKAAMAAGTPTDIGIIAEIKKASPSKGDLCVDLDPATYARIYETAGARAISVLTESVYFKGSLTDLKTVCTHTGLPVLRKDFIIHEYQIYEARQAGAGAVLIITTLLSSAQQSDFIHLIRELNMTPLVEICSEWEMDQALTTGADIVGINNRNLSTLDVDPNAALRMAPLFSEAIIPVAASGFSCRKDIQAGIHTGIFNFLIGESIVKSEDPETFIRSLKTDD